jgi:2-dehydropantoate 2-reductase
MTARGPFVIGTVNDGQDSRLGDIKNILSVVNPTIISTNYIGDLYAKLTVNSCITPLGALSGLYFGELLRTRKFRNIAIGVIRECIALTDAMGVKVERMNRRLDYYKLLEGESFVSDIKRHLVMLVIGFKYRKAKSSSLRSLERGRETEIDYINGHLSAMGRQYNIPTPINDAIIHIIKEIESGKREISAANLDDLLFD